MTVDGPTIFNATLAEADRTEKVKITVNEEKFTFSIKLLLPTNDTTEREEYSNSSSAIDSFVYKPAPAYSNPAQRIFGWVPKPKNETEEDKPEIKAKVD